MDRPMTLERLSTCFGMFGMFQDFDQKYTLTYLPRAVIIISAKKVKS